MNDTARLQIVKNAWDLNDMQIDVLKVILISTRAHAIQELENTLVEMSYGYGESVIEHSMWKKTKQELIE